MVAFARMDFESKCNSCIEIQGASRKPTHSSCVIDDERYLLEEKERERTTRRASSKQKTMTTPQMPSSINLQALLGPNLFATLPALALSNGNNHMSRPVSLSPAGNRPCNNNKKSNLTTGLDSIAAVAAAATHAEDKLAKRRQQIALASRKSRAKRKRELEDLRETNQKLEDEISRLKKRLREMGDDESEVESVKRRCKADDTSSDNSSVVTDEHGFITADPRQSTAETVAKAKEMDPQFKTVLEFIESRMGWYFNQLKDDAAKFHAAGLSDKAKDMLSSLEAQIAMRPTSC